MASGKNKHKHKVVILGAGFAGLNAARKLRRAAVDITIVDRNNHHLFQPLLYQVATGALSPGDIASPIRGILYKQKNVTTLKTSAIGLDPEKKELILEEGSLPYDTLIVATGMKNFYFNKKGWEESAPGLKSLNHAVHLRRQILDAFELAEKESDQEKKRSLQTLTVIGAGPTGVELAGAIAELAHHTLRDDFRNINPMNTRIVLIEGGERILPALHPKLSSKAERDLGKLGVEVMTGSMVQEIREDSLLIQRKGKEESLSTATVIWAAGIMGGDFSGILQEATSVETDRFQRLKVDGNLCVPGFPHICVAGDLAYVKNKDDTVPMMAPAAIQEGKYLANLIKKRLKGKGLKEFKFFDKGKLAVIGRNKAVVEVAGLKFGGFLAWLIWIFIHIAFLIGFDNKLLVLIQWSWTYFTRKRGARLILDE